MTEEELANTVSLIADRLAKIDTRLATIESTLIIFSKLQIKIEEHLRRLM